MFERIELEKGEQEKERRTDTVCDENDPDVNFLRGLNEEAQMIEDAMSRAKKMAEDLLADKRDGKITEEEFGKRASEIRGWYSKIDTYVDMAYPTRKAIEEAGSGKHTIH